MANLRYTTKNSLFKKARNQQIRIFLVGLFFLIILLIFLTYLLPNRVNFILLVSFILFLLIVHKTFNSSAILKAGARGEQNALKILKKLPKSYTIFNQINIPLYNNPHRTQEVDYIIVGSEAVFIIEVKYNSGVISGTKDDDLWVSQKYRHRTVFKNPLKQLTRQLKLLEQYFGTYDIYPNINGALLFTHPKSILKLSREIKNLSFIDTNILTWIKKQNMQKSNFDQELIIKILAFEKQRKRKNKY